MADDPHVDIRPASQKVTVAPKPIPAPIAQPQQSMLIGPGTTTNPAGPSMLAGPKPVETQYDDDANQPMVLVQTPFGPKMMAMRDYEIYLAKLEEDAKADTAKKEAERKARQEEREKRKTAKREALEAEKEKKKDFIVPQALFDQSSNPYGEDKYMTEKVFPPHLYPHLYPDKFPELFPHIYGDKIKRKREMDRELKENKKELILFRDPRATKVSPARRKQLQRILRRVVRTIRVFQGAWVNLSRVVSQRREADKIYFDENLPLIEGHAKKWLSETGGKPLKELLTGRIDIDVTEGVPEKVSAAQSSLLAVLSSLMTNTRGFSTPSQIFLAKLQHRIGYFKPFYPTGFVFEFEKRRFEFSKLGYVRNAKSDKFSLFMCGMLIVVRCIVEALSTEQKINEVVAEMKSSKKKGDNSPRANRSKEGSKLTQSEQEEDEDDDKGDEETGKKNVVVFLSMLYHETMIFVKELLPVREGNVDDPVPKPIRIKVRDNLRVALADGDEEDEEDDKAKSPESPSSTISVKTKPPKQPVTGLLSAKQLKSLLSDSLFITDFRDRVRALLRLFVGEQIKVASDLKLKEIQALYRIRGRIVRACERKWPKIDSQMQAWTKSITKKFGIRESELKSNDRKKRKYEDKGPEDLLEEKDDESEDFVDIKDGSSPVNDD